MGRIQEDYAERRRLQASLPPGESIVIATVENHRINQKAGMICEAFRDVAAMHIFNGTHTVATPEQVSAWREKLRADAEALHNERLQSEQQVVFHGKPQIETR